MSEHWQTFQEVWKELSSLIVHAGHTSAQKLQFLLRNHKLKFLNLLKKNPKNNEDRRKVQSGEVFLFGMKRKLSSEFSNQVIELSDRLNLNEIECVEILWRAYQQRWRHPELELTSLAELLYFQEREFLLNCIVLLFRVRSGATLPHEILALICQFTNELLVEELTLKIINHLNEAIDISSLNESQQTFRAKERRLLADILFSIYYQTTISSQEALALLRLFHDLTAFLKSKNPEDKNELFQVGYILMFTIICFLNTQHELVDPRTGEETTNTLVKNVEFIRSFHQEITKTWTHLDFQAPVLLAWGLFLQQCAQQQITIPETSEEVIDTIINKAIDQEFSKFLVSVLDSSSFKRDVDNIDVYSVILDDLIVLFLTTMSAKVRDIKQEDEERYRALETLSHYNVTGKTESPPKNNFVNLLILISKLYKNQPKLALKYWDYTTNPQLYNFIRFAGDNLTPYFFVPYIKMLASLAAGSENSQLAFYALKNWSNKYVNWNNFFIILEKYYMDFQEPQTEQGLYYRSVQTPTRKIMSPEDVSALEAILSLIREVLGYNESVRTLMYENPNWHALEILFGLLGCSVPPSLKAHLTDAITQFAKSPSLVNKIWLYLEASQVLQTSPPQTGPTKIQEGGIKFELAEIESRNEEYPFVSSFLRLICQLLKYRIVPSDLGLPYRLPGIWPFINFIRDDVFLRFDNRGYKRSEEKWQIVSQCLRIFKILLEQYEPSTEDFETRTIEIQGKTFVLQKPSGFELMSLMLQESSLFKKILSLLEYGVKNFDDEIIKDGGEFFEETVLLSLKIIEIVLEKEEEFLSLNKFSNSPLLLTPINQLFMSNRTQIVNIAQFIHHAENSQIPLLSVRILRLLCLRQDKQNQLVNVFLEAGQQRNLIAGFVERLETDEDFSFPDKLESEDESVQLNSQEIDVEQNERTKSVRVAIVELMLSEVSRPRPSMVHFLLGFNLQFQTTSGTLTDQLHLRTCLHALIDLFANREFPLRYPLLSEKTMEFIYKLCKKPDTHSRVMSYLRTTTIDFFYRQLYYLPAQLESDHIVTQLHFRAWLLKGIALELHVTTSLEQRTNTQRLLSLLFNTSTSQGPEDEFMEEDETEELPLEHQRMKMRELLDPLYFPLKEPPPLTGFTLLNKIDLSKCTETDERHFPHIDITLLHKFLLLALKTSERESIVSGNQQQSQLKQEIETILKTAVAWNRFYLLHSAMCHLFEGWKQVLEVSLHECYEMLRMKSGDAVLYEMIEVTLRLLNNEKIDSNLATLVSQALLILVSKLRISFLLFSIEINEETEGVDPEKYLPIEQLHSIFRGIVNALVYHGTTQRLRGNLYTALLNYLQFTHSTSLSLHSLGEKFEKLWLVEGFETQHRKLILGNMRVLEENAGDKLIETLSNDATDAIPLWKSIAFGTLDAIVRYDIQGRWLNYICQRGFLRHFLDELISQNESLLSVLDPRIDSLNQLYVYESKMSFLLRIAQTSKGATYLVENGLIHTLKRCYFIDRRPDDVSIDFSDWIPSVMERYTQLLLPVLRLLVSLLLALPKNADVAAQVFEFISEHSELFSTILKDRTPVITTFSLQELFLVTSIFYQLSYHTSLLSGKLESRWVKYQNQMLNLLTKYCIQERWYSRTKPRSQVPHTISATTSNVTTKIQRDKSETEVEDEMERLVRNICTNLISFARVLVDNPKGSLSQETESSPVFPRSRIVFAPSLAGATSSDPVRAELDLSSMMSTVSQSQIRAPSLAIIVIYLKYILNQLSKYQLTLQKSIESPMFGMVTASTPSNKNLPNGSTPQEPRSHSFLTFDIPLTGVLDIESPSLTPQQRQLIQHRRETQLVLEKKRIVTHFYYLIENLLFILWKHLDYFINEALIIDESRVDLELKPTPKSQTTTPKSQTQHEKKKRMTLSAESIQLTREQRSALIRDALLSLEQDQHRTLDLLSKISKQGDTSIITILVRKIKDLIETSE